MNLQRRFFLATILGAFVFLFAPSAPAATEGRIIGSFSMPKGVTARLEGKRVSTGASYPNGGLIKTGSTPVTILLNRGGRVIVAANSEVRIWEEDGKPIYVAIGVGGARVVGDKIGSNIANVTSQFLEESGADPLPYLAAFASGNIFPSTGGSSGSNNGTGTSGTGTNPISQPGS